MVFTDILTDIPRSVLFEQGSGYAEKHIEVYESNGHNVMLHSLLHLPSEALPVGTRTICNAEGKLNRTPLGKV
jgi:hypothetical protein